MPDQTEQMARTSPFTREAVLALSERRREPAWMREFRLAAWEAFEQLPPPAPTDEEWRRTDPNTFHLEGIRPFAEAPSGALPPGLQRMVDGWPERAGLLVQRNSQTVRSELDAEAARRGVIFADLDAALRDHPQLIREHFMTTCVRPGESRFRDRKSVV